MQGTGCSLGSRQGEVFWEKRLETQTSLVTFLLRTGGLDLQGVSVAMFLMPREWERVSDHSLTGPALPQESCRERHRFL